MKKKIRNSKFRVVGYYEESPSVINYYGKAKGHIGQYVKLYERWIWLYGPNKGQDYTKDIGIEEVLKAEETK